MNTRKILIKLFILLVFIFVFNVIGQAIIPVSQNQIAMMQMENTVESNMGIQIFSYLMNYSWAIIAFVTVLLFYKEIKFIFNKTKEIFKNEKDN